MLTLVVIPFNNGNSATEAGDAWEPARIVPVVIPFNNGNSATEKELFIKENNNEHINVVIPFNNGNSATTFVLVNNGFAGDFFVVIPFNNGNSATKQKKKITALLSLSRS